MSVICKWSILVGMVCCGCFSNLVAAENPSNDVLRAAIFVQNRAGKDTADKVGVLNDMISTRLTARGFSIIDQNEVAFRFQETKTEHKTEAANDLSSALKTALLELIQKKETKTTVESTITDASALRIAQMLGADYLVFATINSVGSERKEFKGYGIENTVIVQTLRVALKVSDGGQGGSLYGDMVTVSETTPENEFLKIRSDDTLNKLLDNAAVQVANNIESKTESIRQAKPVALAGAEITINSNIEGSSIALDGAVIGVLPNKFTVPAGLHQMSVTKEFCKPWERTVNLFNGQTLSVTLELSDEGIKRYKDIEKFKLQIAREQQQQELDKKQTEAAIDIAREQSTAGAYATEKIAEGEKKKREESYIRSKGFEPKQ